MKIPSDQLTFIFGLIKKKSGITLTEDKTYLLDSKLLPLVKKYQLLSVSDLILKVQKTNDSDLINEIVETMTINESSFFRDSKPFDILNNVVIPKILANNPGKNNIKILSAACSSGQEPYSIAINIREKWKNSTTRFEIKACDISSNILEKAKQGIYNQFEVQRGLPISILLKYFKQVDKNWVISDEVRHMINFDKFNLVESISHLGKFDIIFCRNVLIYFDTETKVRILSNLSNMFEKSGGVLFLGASETVFGMESKFKKLDENASGIYNLQP